MRKAEDIGHDQRATRRLSSGGDLQLDFSQAFTGVIAGFASSPGITEKIDLRDITFGPNVRGTFIEAPTDTSGTLVVTDGTDTADLTLLGQYSAANFQLASDDQGGTLVNDPSSPVASAGNLILAAHG